MTIKKLLFITLFFFIPAFSEIPIEDIGNLYSRFKDDYKFLSPVNGLLLLKSGVLNNIRSYGNYGKEDTNYICHVQIHKRDSDCPHDNTTAFIQQLFPTPAGGRLAVSGSDSDIFYNVTIKDLGLMLKAYVQHKEDSGQLSQFLKHENPSLVTLTKNKRRKIINTFKKSSKTLATVSNIEGIIDVLANMMVNSYGEREKYPAHIIEHTLLALAIHKAHRVGDLDPLLEQLSEFQLVGHVRKANYEKVTYEKIKDYLRTASTKPEEFQEEDLIFTTLGYDKYENPFPVMIGTAQSIFEGIKFSDCGESFLRNLFNIFLSDTANKIFKVDNLNRAFPNASLKLKEFYKEIQKSYEDVKKEKSRLEWAKVVSRLNVGDGPKIIYAFPEEGEQVCNILARGLPNILVVLERLLNDPEITKLRLQQTSEHEKFSNVLDYILLKFSSAERSFTWQAVSKPDLSDILAEYHFDILINGTKYFQAKIGGSSHYDLFKTRDKSETDWRKNDRALFAAIANLPHGLNNTLIPFYVHSNDMIIDDLKLPNNLASSILYAGDLEQTKTKLRALNMAMALKNGTAIEKLIIPWLASITADEHTDSRTAMQITVTLWNIIANGLATEDQLKTKLPDTYEVYSKNSTKIINYYNNLLSYLDYPYASSMILKYVKHFSADQLIKLGNGSLLMKAAESGQASLVEFLLEKAPELASDLSLAKKENSGDTPLKLAIDRAHLPVVELLLDKAPWLASDPNFAKGGMRQENPLHIGLREVLLKDSGNLDIVKILLNKAPQLVTNNKLYEETPFSFAVLFNMFKAVELIAEVMPRVLLEALALDKHDGWVMAIIQKELKKTNRSADTM